MAHLQTADLDTARSTLDADPLRGDRRPEDEVLHLVAGLPPDVVQRRLQEVNRATDLGHRMLAFYLWEMQERRLFQLSGHASAEHYATTRLGMSRRRARELVAAGRTLMELEAVDDAFCKGDLSWSKVRLWINPHPPGCGGRCWRGTGGDAGAAGALGTSWYITFASALGEVRALLRTW